MIADAASLEEPERDSPEPRPIPHTLGHLADPAAHTGPVELATQANEALVGFLRSMLLIRRVERQLAEMKRLGRIGGPVHLGVGQEAVAVGVSAWLRSADMVFGGHRSHSHIIALGVDLRRLFAEVLGKDTGLARGMGGSQHLWDQPNGFYGSVPIVGGTVPIAVGAALAARMQGRDAVAVAYFGDGALEEGVVLESLNLAKVLSVPIVFVAENNLFASHMHISLRQPTDSVARHAAANRIPTEVVDGNDVVAVAAAAARAVGAARAGEGPRFIEAVTFRWYGHVDWREDIDVGLHRSQEEVASWRKRDPIRRLHEAMAVAGWWSDAHQQAVSDEIDESVEQAWNLAEEDPYPDAESLHSRVFGSGLRG